MTWKELLAMPFVLAALAFFVAVGSLAWRIGGTWEPRNTDILITGLVTACAGGMVVVGMVVGMVVGIPFMIRMLQESRSLRYDDYPPLRAPARTIDGVWKELPGDATPLLPMAQPQAPTQQMPTMNVSLDAIDNDDAFGTW